MTMTTAMSTTNEHEQSAAVRHTPIPWDLDILTYIFVDVPELNGTGEDESISDEQSEAIAEANACLVWHAVNNHAALVEALERLVAADNCNYERDMMRSEGLFDAARAALARVRR
jgi:hypothetical protein